MNASSSMQKRGKMQRVKAYPQPFDLIFQVVCSKDTFDTEFMAEKKIIESFRQKREDFEIDAVSSSGMTALTQCVLDGNLKSVKALVALGASVNKKDGQGYTPLHYAASEGYIKIVKFLLRCNADVRAVNRDQEKPMDIADGEDVRKLLSRVALVYSPVSRSPTRRISSPGWL